MNIDRAVVMVMMMMVSAVAGAGMAGAGVVAGAMGSVGIVCPIAKTDTLTRPAPHNHRHLMHGC